MLIVELKGDDFDKSEGFVKVGKIPGAIARAKGANNLLDAERKVFPRINGAVQLGKLNPLDPENLRPLSKSDYGAGIVPFAELVEWGQAIKLFDFRRAQVTVKHLDGISTINSELARAMDEAEKEYRYKYGIDPEYTAQFDAKQTKRNAAEEQEAAAMRKTGRWQVAYASYFVAENSTANVHDIYKMLYQSIGTRELEAYEPGSPVPYNLKGNWQESSSLVENAMHLEVYWDDLNKLLKKNLPRLPETCKFPAPDAPAAKVETASLKLQTQQEDEILRIISRELNTDPLALPANKPGKKGIKADVRSKLGWQGTVFNKAWERLLQKGLLKYLE